MEISRVELLETLESLSPGLSSKDIIEQMTHFIFAEDFVLTYNDLVCIRRPLETGITASVSADDLLKLLRKTKAETLNIVKKGEVLRIEAGRMVAELNLMIENDLKEQIGIIDSEIFSEEAEWIELPTGFKEGISLCQYAASSDESLPILTNLWINNDKIVGFDNTRLSVYTMKGELPEFLLKAKRVKDLLNYEITDLLLTDSWAHFLGSGDLVFSVRRIQGEFDNVLPFVDKHKGDLVDLPIQEFRQAVDVVSTITEKEDLTNRWVEITISEGEVLCKAEKDARGWVKETFPHESKVTKSFSFEVNPTFLLDILNEKMALYIGTQSMRMSLPNFSHLLGVK